MDLQGIPPALFKNLCRALECVTPYELLEETPPGISAPSLRGHWALWRAGRPERSRGLARLLTPGALLSVSRAPVHWEPGAVLRPGKEFLY